jgi:hypothetical protein
MTHRSVDRELVERLLKDESLSFREIARRANCSDWSVRSIARESDDDYSCDYAEGEPPTAREWGIFAGMLIAVFGGIWLLARRFPPMDGAM